MKTPIRLLAIFLLSLLLMGQQCQSTDTVILPEGPKATQLGKTKDEQIVGLVTQVKAEQAARELEQALAAKAASNFLGVLKALDYMDASPAREAASEESKLGIQRLGKDDPVETVKSLQRVIDLVTGQRDKALRDYEIARGETTAEKARVVAKDKEIADRDAAISARESRIAVLEQEKTDEQAAHVRDVKDALAKKDAEIKRIKDEAASKERAAWVLWTRIAGLAFIVIGAVIAIIFKIIPEGASFVGVGVLIGLISIFIDWLTAQWFFPWLCGGIILVTFGVGGYALYRMWKKNTLQVKVTAALQDLKDESKTLGNDVWSKVSEHLDYRLGDKDGVAQKKLAANLGLTNPDAEKK